MWSTRCKGRLFSPIRAKVWISDASTDELSTNFLLTLNFGENSGNLISSLWYVGMCTKPYVLVSHKIQEHNVNLTTGYSLLQIQIIYQANFQLRVMNIITLSANLFIYTGSS